MTVVEMHMICTLSRRRLPARTARIVLPVTLPGTADTPHAESGMRYQIPSFTFRTTVLTDAVP